jgi:hypothetical protein
MPRTPKNVIGSWHLLVENYSTSAQDFYAAIEEAFARRKLPKAKQSRVTYKESGIGSAKREYLRIRRGGVVFDICAAPYGTGYFFSWWTARPVTVGSIVLVLATILAIPFLLFRFLSAYTAELKIETMTGFFMLLFLLCFLSYFILGLLVREHVVPGEGTLLAVPYVGALYEALFAPLTYYRLDTALMFQESVRAAVNEVIEGLRNEQGLRALTPEELRPRMIGLGS